MTDQSTLICNPVQTTYRGIAKNWGHKSVFASSS